METVQVGSSSEDDDDVYLNSVAKLNGMRMNIVTVINNQLFKLFQVFSAIKHLMLIITNFQYKKLKCIF